MMEGTTTRPLGIVLRTLYPGAFASHQGVTFRVVSPGSEIISGVSPDNGKTEKIEDDLLEHPNLAKKVYKIIRKQIEQDTGILLPEHKRRPIRVVVPGKIDLRIDETLENVYCTNYKCGTLWKLGWLNRNQKSRGLPKCALCGFRVQQAPIFVPVIEDSGIAVGGAGMPLGSTIQNLPYRMLFCHYKTPKDRCKAPTSVDRQCVPREQFKEMLGSLVMRNPQRPIDSLRLCNPDCPKGLQVPDIQITRPQRVGNTWFRTDFPREALNVPLHASAVETFEGEEPDVDEVNEVVSTLLGRFFDKEVVDYQNTKFMSMKILETVYGYRTGSQNTGSTTSYIGIDRKTVLGRITNTKGFQITIKPEIYERISAIKEKKKLHYEDEEILEVILHSLKHSLLVEMPVFTGLDEHKFHGTFEINEKKHEWAARVYVYDTEDGGSGGFSTIMGNKEILVKVLDDVRLRKINCPVRECSKACKHCIYIKNCGFVNRKLNRKLLIESGIFLTT